MALIHSLESSGNTLFRYRGQIPVVLFICAVPTLYFTNISAWDPVWIWVAKISAMVLSLVGFIVRAYAIGTTPRGTSGRNTKQQVAESLNTTGIYSSVRHPLYLGNYFMWIGIVAYTMNPWFILSVSLAYWIYYERIMFAEERFLEGKFGDSYMEWSKKVPAFWPSYKNYIKNAHPFSLKMILRREYSGILATVIGFLFVDVVRDFFISLETDAKFEFNCTYLWVLGATVLYALIFRSIKHYTSWLDEEGRS